MSSLQVWYKQTEMWYIPSNWEIFALWSIWTFSKGRWIKKDEVITGWIPCIRYWELYTKYNEVASYIHSSISKEVAQSSKKAKEWDLFFAWSGETKEEIWRNTTVVGCKEFYLGWDIIILSPKSIFNSVFLSYLLNSKGVQRQKTQYAQWDAVVHLYSSWLSKIVVSIPIDKKEQIAIATALSDIDSCISEFDTLITKQQQIKKGTMQQLLTWKKRLSGFSGKWEEVELWELSHIATGSTPPTNDQSNYGTEWMFVWPWDFSSSMRICYTAKKLSTVWFQKARAFPRNSILFTCIWSTIGKCWIASRELTSNQQINAIFPWDHFDYKFLYFQLCNIAPLIKSKAWEQAVPMISKSDFSKFSITLPSFKEQKAIAQVLSNIDTHIQTLKTKKKKYEMIKLWIMQKLLTGQIRLV